MSIDIFLVGVVSVAFVRMIIAIIKFAIPYRALSMFEEEYRIIKSAMYLATVVGAVEKQHTISDKIDYMKRVLNSSDSSMLVHDDNNLLASYYYGLQESQSFINDGKERLVKTSE